jgi:hypothetical protein
MFTSTSLMFFPHAADAPGSCINVFARSMGFVTVTARHDATAELGMDTQLGSGSFFVLRSTASRRGSTSVDEADVDDDDVDAVDAVARVIPRDEPMRGDRATRSVAVGDGDDDAFW